MRQEWRPKLVVGGKTERSRPGDGERGNVRAVHGQMGLHGKEKAVAPSVDGCTIVGKVSSSMRTVPSSSGDLLQGEGSGSRFHVLEEKGDGWPNSVSLDAIADAVGKQLDDILAPASFPTT
ncbi:hypothetical protein Dimus_009701 [Dionaea muscipula]